MNRFVDLLESSALVQAALALLVVGADVWLFVNSQPVPAELWTLTTLVVGFYFGAKSQAQFSASMRAAARREEP